MLLLVRADRSFAIQTGSNDEAARAVSCWPAEAFQDVKEIVPWDGDLPQRGSRERWRWDGTQIIVLADETEVAQQEAAAIQVEVAPPQITTQRDAVTFGEGSTEHRITGAAGAPPPPVTMEPMDGEEDEPFEMPRVFRNDIPPAPEPPAVVEDEPEEYYDDRPDFGAELAAFKARADDFLSDAARRVRSLKAPEPAVILADHYEGQIRYEIAIRSINGDAAAMEMMAPVAHAMGMGIVEAAHAIVADRKQSERNIMAAYAAKLGDANAADNRG